jgi:hypothetical protein
MVALVAALAAAAASAAAPAVAAPWYWSPGLCKSILINYGVTTADGRKFRASDARCIGEKSCILRSGSRLYSDFVVALVDRVGVVRTARLHVTGKAASSILGLKIWSSTRWAPLVGLIDKGLTTGSLRPLDPSECSG